MQHRVVEEPQAVEVPLKITDQALPVLKPEQPKGVLELKPDRDGNVWASGMYQGGIYMLDTKTNQVIWRGRASGTLEMKGVDKKISKSVEKLVKQFIKDTTKKA